MANGALTIEVASTENMVSLASFLSVANNTLDILQELYVTLATSPHSIDWQITDVSMRSPVKMTIAASSPDESNVINSIVNAYVDGFRRLDESAQMPPYFTERTLDHAKKIVGVLNYDVSRLAFSTNGTSVTPTQRVAANVDAITRGYEDKATFEGQLEMISVHAENLFGVYDRLTGQKISCRFPDVMLEQSKAAFNHRVSVYGTTKYNREGKPRYVQVEQLRVLRDAAELPQFEDVHAINITDGDEAARYVRRLRDA